MTLSEIKKELKKLATTNLPKALEKFEKVILSESYRYNDIILQQGSYNSLNTNKLRGTLSESRAIQQENQIRYAIIDMIDMIEEEDVDFGIAQDTFKAKKNSPPPAEDNNNTPPNPPAASNTPASSDIYISYAWGGQNEMVVDILDKDLQLKGLKIIRDKRDLGYKGSIVGFMEDIGKGNKIIVVISEKYLKSENCMFELVQIYENKDFAKRIFPIILEDANIYSPVGRINYINHWDDKIKELDDALKTVERGTNLTSLQGELNNYGKIRAAFDNMAFILKDMNALTPDMHRNEDFKTLYEYLTR